MGVNAMDLLAALGGGLEGYSRYSALSAEQKRRNEELERQRKRDEEMAKDRDEDREDRKRARADIDRQKRESATEKAMSELMSFYGGKGVVLNPETVRTYVETRGVPRSSGADAGFGTSASDLAMNAIAASGAGLGDRISRESAEALRKSGATGGSVVDLSGNLGYAQDRNAALSALRKAETDARETAEGKVRLDVARIMAGGRRDERSDKAMNDLLGAEGWFNSVVQGGRAMADATARAERDRVADAFDRMRAAHPDWSPQKIMLAVQKGVTSDAGLDLRVAQTRRADRTAGVGGRSLSAPPGVASSPVAPPTAPTVGGKPMSPRAYQAARAAGYSDDEIRRSGYVIPKGG